MKFWGLFWGITLSLNIAIGAEKLTTTSTAENKRLAREDFGSISIGHNLSTNAHTLKKGQISLGTLYAAVGITDNWSIGSSIFVITNFMMHNFMTRYAFDISDKERIGIDLAYFKTFGGKEIRYPNGQCQFGPAAGSNGKFQKLSCSDFVTYDGFLMEAGNIKATYSRQIKKSYRFNTTAAYFHYWDDRVPFSFRMDPANDDNYAINLTTLHEIRLGDHKGKKLFLNLEGGFWGLNYQYPYYHAGLTLNFQGEMFIAGIGMSSTFNPNFPKNQVKQFGGGYDSRASYHPEFEFQILF